MTESKVNVNSVNRKKTPKTRFHELIVAPALLILLMSPANAQEDNFDFVFFDSIPEISADALRAEQPLSDAAASVTVITAAMIDDFGYRTIGEMLSAQSGFYLSDDGARSYVGVRGLSSPGEFNSRILFMVNGQRLNDGGLDAWFSGDNNPIDIRLIERVEIIRGPGTSAYGPNAWLGVINVITKTGRSRGGLDVYAGTDDQRRNIASIAYGTRLDNGLEFDASLRVLRDKGSQDVYVAAYDNPATNNGIAEDLNRDYGETILLNGSWQDFQFQYGLAKYDAGTPAAPFFASFNDPRTNYADKTRFGMIKWRRILANNIDVEVRLHQERTQTDITTPLDSQPPFFPGGVQLIDISARTRSIEANVSRKFNHHTLSAGVFLIRKSPLRGAVSLDQETIRKSGIASNFDSIFIEDEASFGDHSRLLVGLRLDKSDMSSSQINPRIAWIQGLNDKADLKVILAKAVREPNWSENSYIFTRPQEAFDLEQEGIRTLEVQLTAPREHLDWHISIFEYDFDQLITPTVDPTINGPIYVNAQTERHSHGIEINRKLKLKYFDLGTNITYVQSTIGDDKQRAQFAPRITANLNLTNWYVRPTLRLSMEARYRGNQLGYRNEKIPGALLVFGSLHWEPSRYKNFELALRLRNLLDESYADPLAAFHLSDRLTQPGRTIGLELFWRP